MKRVVAIAGLVLVAVLAVQLLGGGGESRSFEVPVEEQERVDDGPGLGNVRVFSGPLREDGDRAGRVDGECRVTSVRPEPRERCELTVTLGDGEQEVQLAGVRRTDADDVVLSVTGGSGDYVDARGQVVLAGERLTLELED
jgi:hypothetical protein